ncbi:MAG: elongation factor Ts [Solobacterium sp.]|nr:elongation factor Ts [Solobacterium sp.]MBR2793937.1 elongation factor Ts [Solobacterium sp.]
MAITAAQVKQLRDETGAGMMDCKKALTETDGNMEAAKDWLRKKGISKAEKKEGRTAAEGLSRVIADGNKAVMVEINTETDFVAKNDKFLALLEETVTVIKESNPKDVEAALAVNVGDGTLNDQFINATAIIGEKIKLRRFEVVEKADDEIFGVYMHNGGQISALTVLKGGDAQVAKEMAMQVASMTPTYVSRSEMPAEVIAHEKEILLEQMNNDPAMAKKPENVKEKIVEGRLSKNLEDLCLVDQIFFLDQDKKVGQYLKEKGAEVVRFVRYKVGEGIEKKAEDFAAEVAAMAK